jgi:hypothetical protein
MEFVGVAENRKEQGDIMKLEVTTFRTLNEGRAELGLEALPGGDVPLNAEYLKHLDGSMDDGEVDGLFEEVEAEAGGADDEDRGDAGEKIVPRDEVTGGLVRFFATWAAVGTWDGATVALQVFLAGAWHTVVAGITADGVQTLTTSTAPWGQKFRFNISGGGGSEVLSIEVATEFELDFVAG